MLTILGRSRRIYDGMKWRDLLRVGGLSVLAGLVLPMQAVALSWADCPWKDFHLLDSYN